MNPDSPEFAEQLRQATSRRDPAAALDPDLAALRGGFLALGRALEAAADDVDEKRLVAGLTETQVFVAPLARQPNRESSDEQRTMLWLAATAALLLLAVGVVAYATRGKPTRDQVVQPNKETPQVTPDGIKPELAPPVPESQIDAPQVASDDATMNADDDALDWNDSLDESFATAERLVGQAGRLSNSAEARVEVLYKRIQSASEDMQSGSL